MVCENQLYQAHKEMERVKRDMGGPGGQANMSEVVRVQSEWVGLGVSGVHCVGVDGMWV